MANLWAVSLSRYVASAVYDVLCGTVQGKACGVSLSSRCSLQVEIQSCCEACGFARLSGRWHWQETSGIHSSLLPQNNKSAILHHHIEPSACSQQNLRQLDGHKNRKGKSDKIEAASQSCLYERQQEEADSLSEVYAKTDS